MTNKELEDLVYNYPTKHKWGFIESEQKDILSKFPNINMEKYKDAMMCNTCMLDEVDGIIIYHRDILLALKCGVQNRDMKLHEWD